MPDAVMRELVFSSRDEGTEGKVGDKRVIWKDILREGEFAMTPGLTGTIKRPFKVVKDGVSSGSNRVISLTELEANFRDKAVEHVTIPTSHRDNVLDNTGFIEDVRTVVKKGKSVLQGAFGFTEPDIAGKVRRGTIPNCSSGVMFDHTRKADGKQYNACLYHVALTKSPWIPDLEPFKAVIASDDTIEGSPDVEAFQFAETLDDTASTDDTGKKAEVMWDSTSGFNWVREQINEQLRPDEPALDDGRPTLPKPWYYVEDVSEKLALVTQHFKGAMERLLIPYSRTEDNSVELAPSIRWQPVKEAMIAASDHIADGFDEMTLNSIRDRLATHLTDEFGDKASTYEVEEVAVNSTAKIRNKATQQAWVASFFSDGKVTRLSPSSAWESVEAPKPKSDPPKSVIKAIITSDDSLAGRRKRVIEERKRQLARTNP